MIKFTKSIIDQVLDNNPLPIIIVAAHEPGLPVVYLNSALEHLLARDSAEVMGMPFTDIMSAGNLPANADGRDAEATPYTDCEDSQTWRSGDGSSLNLKVRIAPLHDRPGQTGYWMLSVVDNAQSPDVTRAWESAALRSELVDARRQIESLQRIDSLTGLANRGAFEELLERDWAIACREKRQIGIVVFSVDYLAEYSDIYGRHATDALLRKVVHAINGSLRRASDFGARIAEDRFAVLICNPDQGHIETCVKSIEAKIRNLAIHHPRSTVSRFISISYGLASEVPVRKKKSATLLAKAVSNLEAGFKPTRVLQTEKVSQADD
ncbi:MAG TPA: diguanylate cyclase [Gammaproteobacteria bacterium]|jgi:diguanylate cyclase (GGDEF)-like protein|nr:diguanylate cyclase [Gammaproteobacteria bacterium]HJP39156.1 diguanylate cyclase [Gammaproteobacteria bacterium]